MEECELINNNQRIAALLLTNGSGSYYISRLIEFDGKDIELVSIEMLLKISEVA